MILYLIENAGLLGPDLVLEVGPVEALSPDRGVPQLKAADGVVSHHLWCIFKFTQTSKQEAKKKTSAHMWMPFGSDGGRKKKRNRENNPKSHEKNPTNHE